MRLLSIPRVVSSAGALVVIGAVACGPVANGCGSRHSSGSTTGTATVTGTFDLVGGACARGATAIRFVDSGGNKTDATLDGQCAFSATVSSGVDLYAGVLDGTGKVFATLAWEDPTVLDDGLTFHATSFFRLAPGTSYDFAGIHAVPPAPPVTASIGTISLAGINGLFFLPEHPPTEVASSADGIPDSAKSGYTVGSDAVGNQIPVPQASTPTCTLPTTGMLYGQVATTLFQPLSSDDEAFLQANASLLTSPIQFVADGFMQGPIPAHGMWIVYGSPAASPQQMVMTDTSGRFSIDASTIPPGVFVARVVRDAGDDPPLSFLPLCMLQQDPSQVTTTTQVRAFPDGCSMDAASEARCSAPPPAGDGGAGDAGDDGSAATDSGAAMGGAQPGVPHHCHGPMPEEPAPPVHRPLGGGGDVCGTSNIQPCCLDYDGKISTNSKATNIVEKSLHYFGSTCERYVDVGCCVNEGGTMWQALEVQVGSFRPLRCWDSHAHRNCQNIDLTAGGLVFSASKATRDAHDPATDPESITVDCNSTTTLYNYNNTCQNRDNIIVTSASCGSLRPSGYIAHDQVQGPGPLPPGGDNILTRDVVFYAPSAPCTQVVRSQAAGLTRSIAISVVCNPGGTTTTPEGGASWSINPLTATFVQAEFATHYDVTVTGAVPPALTVSWSLALTLVDKSGAPDPSTPGSGAAVDIGCSNAGVGTPNPLVDTLAANASTDDFVWHHPDAVDSTPPGMYACNHADQGPSGHQGLITAVVSDGTMQCTATYKGTHTSDATNSLASTPVCKHL